MAYLNLDPTYFTHRKTIRLVARLGVGAELLPIKLWAYCAQHHPKDGTLADYTEAELGALLGVNASNAKDYIEAMLAVGFLDRTKSGILRCHDWLEHQGHLKAFKERAEKAAAARWGESPQGKRPPRSNAPSIAKDDDEQSSSNAPTVPTVPTLPDNNLPPSAGVVESPIPKHFTYPDDFERFWGFYPRKSGKGAAFKAWKRLSAEDKTAAIERAEWVQGCYKHHDPHEDRLQFCKHAATWLNARGWEDANEEVVLAARGR